ncbi:hypothetical protein J2Y02_004126 [Neobacillus drentensis]|nr:hypothetical protein [Neobacillus drentensis]
MIFVTEEFCFLSILYIGSDFLLVRKLKSLIRLEEAHFGLFLYRSF